MRRLRRRSSTRRTVGLWLLVIGLIVGLGSQLAGPFFSGHVVAGAPLGFEHFAGGVRARFPFSLTADQLPASVVVHASAHHGSVLQPADPPAERWLLRLTKDGNVVRTHPMHLRSTLVESSPPLAFKEAVPLDLADGAGDYVLEVERPAAPRLTLDTARAEVRAGVESADRTWFAVGLTLIVAGLAFILTA